MCKWNPDNRHPFRSCNHGHRDHEELFDPLVLPNQPPAIWCNACWTLCAFYSSQRVYTGFRALVSDMLSGHPIPQARRLSQISSPKNFSAMAEIDRPGVSRYQEFGAFNEARRTHSDMDRYRTYTSAPTPADEYPYPPPGTARSDSRNGRSRRGRSEDSRRDGFVPGQSRGYGSTVGAGGQPPPPASAPSEYDGRRPQTSYGSSPTRDPFSTPTMSTDSHGSAFRSPLPTPSPSRSEFARSPSSSHPSYHTQPSYAPPPPPMPTQFTNDPYQNSRFSSRSQFPTGSIGRGVRGPTRFPPPSGPSFYDDTPRPPPPPVSPRNHAPVPPPSSYRSPNAFSTAFSQAVPGPYPSGTTPLATPVNEYYYNQSHDALTPDANSTYYSSSSGYRSPGAGSGRTSRRTGYESTFNGNYGGGGGSRHAGGGGSGNHVRFADWDRDRDDLNGLR